MVIGKYYILISSLRQSFVCPSLCRPRVFSHVMSTIFLGISPENNDCQLYISDECDEYDDSRNYSNGEKACDAK